MVSRILPTFADAVFPIGTPAAARIVRVECFQAHDGGDVGSVQGSPHAVDPLGTTLGGLNVDDLIEDSIGDHCAIG